MAWLWAGDWDQAAAAHALPGSPAAFSSMPLQAAPFSGFMRCPALRRPVAPQRNCPAPPPCNSVTPPTAAAAASSQSTRASPSCALLQSTIWTLDGRPLAQCWQRMARTAGASPCREAPFKRKSWVHCYPRRPLAAMQALAPSPGPRPLHSALWRRSLEPPAIFPAQHTGGLALLHSPIPRV